MRILLTGGSGFLGKKVARLLEKRGIEIFNLTRRPFGGANEILWDFFGMLPELPRVDLLLHMAASVDFSNNTPELLLGNTVPAIRLADWCSHNGVPVFHTSTAAIHGKNTPWGYSTHIAPAGHYAASKLISETALRTVCPACTVFRIGGIYGFNGPRHLGLNDSINNALLYGKNPILVGKGFALRNYISVDDTAAWIAAEICAPHQSGGIIYIAGKEIMPIRQWLQTIVDILLPDGKIEEFPGEDSSDIIVEASPSQVELLSFSEYLHKL